jgi:hypothetical protein
MKPRFSRSTPGSHAFAKRVALAFAGLALSGQAISGCDDAADSSCNTQAQASSSVTATLQSPLAALQDYLQQRGADPSNLNMASAVDVMLDWYRRVPMGAQGEDQLVFRYGGWSEGCATAFKLSLLRRIAASGDSSERLAGITLMFEPGGQQELVPFDTHSGSAASLEVFIATIKGSPAYKRLAQATPMAVLVEAGAVR